MPGKFTGGEWAGIITACVGIVTAAGAIVKSVFGRKRSQLETLREQYDWLERKYEALNEKVDRLYEQVHELERVRLDLIRENNELKLALKEAEHNICLVPDDECLRRLPRREQCRLMGALRGEYAKDHPSADFPEIKDNDEVSEEPDKE